MNFVVIECTQSKSENDINLLMSFSSCPFVKEVHFLASHLNLLPFDQVGSPFCAYLVVSYVSLVSLCSHFVEGFIDLD